MFLFKLFVNNFLKKKKKNLFAKNNNKITFKSYVFMWIYSILRVCLMTFLTVSVVQKCIILVHKNINLKSRCMENYDINSSSRHAGSACDKTNIP